MSKTKKIAWVDCHSGIAGNMLLGALIDLGFPARRLNELSDSFKLGRVKINVSKTERGQIQGTLVDIKPEGKQPARNLSDIVKIINKARLPETVKDKSIETFTVLAKAEARAHKMAVDKVHFHELGAVDTIIDIAGVVLGFYELKIENIYSSRIRLGGGEVRCAHGLLPVPPPAVLELSKGLPVAGGGACEGELATPTGVALIKTLASGFGPMPEMKVMDSGCGLGGRELAGRANLLRVVVGEETGRAERLIQIEATIDDMNPEFYDTLIKRMSEAGALETALLQTQLKKNRPGVVLRGLCAREDLEKLLETIFVHSTTTGIRYYEVERVKLARRAETVKTVYGPVKVKVIALPDGRERVHPEFDDLAGTAVKFNLSLPDLDQEVKALWRKKSNPK
jgi:pyridinium-3,5-bisthiocarboxylic acid mononucleotide nickel chelatase